MDLIYLIIGLLIGGISSWLIAKHKFLKSNEIPIQNIEKNYVQKSIYEQLYEEKKQMHDTIVSLNSEKAVLGEKASEIEKRLAEHKSEIGKMQEAMKLEFKDLSNQILEEKSTKFIQLNEEKVQSILNPLKEKISEFEKKVDDTYRAENEERISLKTELGNIIKLNKQVSEDANKLTLALKGDKRIQGNWGEIQLEQILNKVGFEKDYHYRKQESLSGEDGNRLRPDFIINLPDENV